MTKTVQMNRWVRLAAAVLVLMFSGIIYAWSNINLPLTGFGWSASLLTFNYTLSVWFFCIGGLISGFLSKKVSAKLRMMGSSLLLFAGFWLVSCLQNGSSIVLLYLGYALMAGTGIGIVYNAVIATISGWFPDKKGLCSGSLMMGFGLSSFLIGLLAGSLLEAGSVDWRVIYRVMGAVCSIVIFLGAFLIKAPEKTAVKAAKPLSGMTSGQMLKRPSFWKLFIYFILLSAVGSSAIAFARSYSISLGIAQNTAVVFAAVVAIANSLGRLASGAIADHFGLTKTKYITSAVAIIAPLLALLGAMTASPLLGIPGLLLCGFSYGFSPTVSAAFTMEFYGQRDYASNLSIINLVLIPGAFVPTLASAILTASGGSYVPVFSLLIGFSLIGLVINLTIKEA